MGMRRLFVLVFALCALTLLSFCNASPSSSSSASMPGSASFVLDEGSAGSALVTAAAGGVVRTTKGDTLTVPPGAVIDDVTITMTPLVFPTDGRIDVFGGVVMTPERLEFLVPATLTLTLAQPLEPGVELELAESHDLAIPASFGPANELYVVAADGRTATGPVQGFTGKIVEKNCHAGTRDNVLAAWGGRSGRDDGSISRVTGLDVPSLRSCEQLGADPLQTMISPYFAQCAEFLSGQPFDPAARATIAATLASGRQVVFLFGAGMTVDPKTKLRTRVDHSAVAIANGDGSISIRNQVNITNPQTVRELDNAGKTSTLDLPLADIDKPNGMRDLRKGETLAILKGEPFDRSIRGPAWPQVIVLCETSAEPDAGTPSPTSATLRIKVITTSSQDPNDTLADPLFDVDVLIGSSTAHVPADDDVARTTVSAGVQVVKFPRSNGLDAPDGTHLYKVGSINVHVTKEGSSGKRCAPRSQEGDLPVKLEASASNPTALSEYEIGIRIVPFDAPPLAKADNCN